MKENYANLPWKRIGARIIDNECNTIADLNDPDDSQTRDVFPIAHLIVESVNNHDKLIDLVYKMFKQQVQNAPTTAETKNNYLCDLVSSGFGDAIADCARRYLVKGCFFDMQLTEKFIDKYYDQLAQDVITSAGDDRWSTEDVEIAVRRIIARMCGLED